MKNNILKLALLALLSFYGNLYAQSNNLGVGTSLPGSKLTVNGSLAAAYQSVTANAYSVSENDFYIIWNGSAAGTVTLPASTTGGGTANLFPNPAKSSVKFVYENYSLEGTQLLKVRLMDLQGRLLIEKELEIKNGSNELQLELSAFADGIYYLNYANDANTIKGSIRMMKG